MNYQLPDEYFPVKRKFPERVANWVRCDSSRNALVRNDVLHLTEHIIRAPLPEVVGKKIAFISDWHWHGSPENFKVLEELENGLKKNKVDYLILGGDICESADRIKELPELLRRLRKLAKTCIAIPGNWECGKRWLPENFWKQFYADCGMIFLQNDCFQDDFFRFHGMDDISSGYCRFRTDSAALGSLPVAEVLLAHSPDAVIALDEGTLMRNVDLILCGHNHGGQVRLPIVGPLYCPSRYGKHFDRGVFSWQATHTRMLVSSGIGEASGTFRWNCPHEALIISFRPSRHYRLRKDGAGKK